MKVFISTGFSRKSLNMIVREYELAYRKLMNRFGENSIQLTNEYISKPIFKGRPEELLYYDVVTSNSYGEPLLIFSQIMKNIAEADCIYFCEGWQDYRGCRIEHKIAEEYDIPMLYWYQFD